MKDPDTPLPAPLPKIGINLTREIVLQQLTISEQSKVQSVAFDCGISDPVGEHQQIWKVILFRNFNSQHVTNLLLDSVFICSLGTSAQRRQWHPTPVLLPGKSHGRRSLVGYSPWGHTESDMTERLHFHFSLSRIGEGNGNPLQCSCLENPRDGGAWWAAVHGLA